MDGLNEVEKAFQAAKAELDTIEAGLEAEVGYCWQDSKNTVTYCTLSLLQQVARVKEEFVSLVNELEAVKLSEKEAVKYFRDALPQSCRELQRLCIKAGLKDASWEKSEQVKRVEALLEGPLLSGPWPIATAPLCHATEVYRAAGTPDSDEDKENTDCPAQWPGPERVAQPAVPSNVLRLRSADFVPIDEAEFNSVSDLVRGRIKLSEVNSTYLHLYRHFREEQNKVPLSVSDMDKMGMRITGKSGQAKLKVLQSLRLIQMSSKGDVKLL